MDFTCVLRWQKRTATWHLFNILLLAPNFGAVLRLLWINKGPICLLGATEQLPLSHLFLRSTALFALSNICVLRTLTKAKSKSTFVYYFASCSEFRSSAPFAPNKQTDPVLRAASFQHSTAWRQEQQKIGPMCWHRNARQQSQNY